jgi:hypothetical protein
VNGYSVRFEPVGAEDPQAGPPTQMAVLHRAVPGTAEREAVPRR